MATKSVLAHIKINVNSSVNVREDAKKTFLLDSLLRPLSPPPTLGLVDKRTHPLPYPLPPS